VNDEPWEWREAQREETLRAYGSVEAWRAAIDEALAALPTSVTHKCDACQRRIQVYDLRRVETSEGYQAGRRCAKCVGDVVGLVFTLEALRAAAPRKRRKTA